MNELPFHYKSSAFIMKDKPNVDEKTVCNIPQINELCPFKAKS